MNFITIAKEHMNKEDFENALKEAIGCATVDLIVIDVMEEYEMTENEAIMFLVAGIPVDVTIPRILDKYLPAMVLGLKYDVIVTKKDLLAWALTEIEERGIL